MQLIETQNSKRDKVIVDSVANSEQVFVVML
jgi:hypothetical protein